MEVEAAVGVCIFIFLLLDHGPIGVEAFRDLVIVIVVKVGAFLLSLDPRQLEVAARVVKPLAERIVEY